MLLHLEHKIQLMRQPLLLSTLLLSVGFAQAQQISNVTISPTPVRTCQWVTFHVTGTGGPNLSFSTIQATNTSTSITLVASTSVGNGSAPFNRPIGPLGSYDVGTYALSISLEFNGVITSTWTGSMTVIDADPGNVGDFTEITVCPNAAPFALFSRLEGTPDAGGQWLNPLLQPVPTGMFVPGTSLEGEYQYYFDVPPPCTTDYQSMLITYYPNNSAGTNATVSLCTAPGAPPVNLFTQLGGTPDAGGTWTGLNTTGIFTPGVSQPGQYVYHVTGIAPCTDPSATVTVTGAPPSNPGVGGPAVFCFDETAANLNTYVTGEDSSGIWYTPDGIGITFFNGPVDVSTYGPGAYAYVVETPPCPADTSFVTVTLDGPPCTLGIPAGQGGGDRLLLAPNPATDKVVVEIGRKHPGAGQFLELSDVNGRVVLRRALHNNGNSVREVLDVSSLVPGAYTLRLAGAPAEVTERLMVR